MPSKKVFNRKNTRGKLSNTRHKNTRKNMKTKKIRVLRRNKKGGMRRAVTPIVNHIRNIGKELAKGQLENIVNDNLERFSSPRKTPYSAHKLSQILSNESEHNYIRNERINRTPLKRKSRGFIYLTPTPKQFIPSPNSPYTNINEDIENEYPNIEEDEEFKFISTPNKKLEYDDEYNNEYNKGNIVKSLKF
jgi:hypothetical protein